MVESTPKNNDDLYVWNAPVRPFKKRDRVFYQTVIALTFLLVVISLFLREWLLAGAVLAVVFVSYVLAAVPPPTITNKITKKGVWVSDTFYNFKEINQYWFESQLGNELLVLVLHGEGIRVSLVLPEGKKEKVTELITEKIVYRDKPLRGFIDKAAGWMKNKIPLEEPTKTS